jgi:hypothetical protein
MSDSPHESAGEPDPDDKPSSGPNLIVIYSLIALALATAIGLAMTIVLPFYHRR